MFIWDQDEETGQSDGSDDDEVSNTLDEKVFQICCGAHTLQLCVWDSLKKENNFYRK